MNRKVLSYVLFVFGILLIGGAGFLLMHTSQPVPSQAAGDVPKSLGGFALAEKITGADAVTEIKNLHLGDFALSDAVVAVYGSQNVLVWVADAGSTVEANSLLTAMDQAILSATDSPFALQGVYVFSGREVRSLEGLGQMHFYFASGSKVIWVSADYAVAEKALQELLQYYPAGSDL